ncbi:MAG TPA: sulfite exporter TauE/SafE family protein [Acidiphilium sp.]
MPLAFVTAGFVVGILVGLTGVGGGSIMTPLLVLVFAIHPSAAIGTDLLFAAITKTAGTLVHGANHTVDWRVVRLMASGSLPGAVFALLVLDRIGVHGHAANELSIVLLGVMLVVAAISLALKPWLNRHRKPRERGPSRAASPALTIAPTVALGLVLGITVTLSSVGAGALGTVALIYLYPDLPISRIVGSDIAHAVALTLVAGLGRLWLHSIDFGMLGALLAGSIPGIVIGSMLVRKAPEQVLRIALAIILCFVGLRMLWKVV